MQYKRKLKYQTPPICGEDVTAIQTQLAKAGFTEAGTVDGVFSINTDVAVRAFQQSVCLDVDGVVGPLTWSMLFGEPKTEQILDKIKPVIDKLKIPHAYKDSVVWCLTDKGVVIGVNNPETSGGEPITVRKVWQQFGTFIEIWSDKFGVPAELIMATICTETSGDPKAVREEPGYESDDKTPAKISAGLMQTLISTARSALGDDSINRSWLLEPVNSIRAGAAYIASQWKETEFDPPKVACAYNAGGVYYNGSLENRWKMKQYPINSSAHADRFIKWFNDCFLVFDKESACPNFSFYKLLKG